MGESRLVDVAARAGVSLRTASRVLNEDPRVAQPTRHRVLAAIRELRFEPDTLARTLRAGTDTAVGLVVESIADPFFAEVADAVETVMARHGRSVLVASTRRQPDQESAVVRRMVARRVAGLLVVPSGGEQAWPDSTPVVLIDRASPGIQADLIDIDDRAAAYNAVSHLIRHGHRRIAYVGDSIAIPTSAARLRGYRDALAAHGLTEGEDIVIAHATGSGDAAVAVHALLDRAVGSAGAPTALFSASTRVSLGAVPVLHARGRTDLAFVGLGDFAMADALVPGVTVVDHSGARIGAAAAERMLARLGSPGLPVEHIRLDAPLVMRGSGERRP